VRIVGGEARGRLLKGPKTAGTRPVLDRVKTALFDILGARLVDRHVLDLFGGTGAIGLEALSRGAKHATFVEMNHQMADILRENARSTGLADRAEIIRGDAFRYLDLAAVQGRRYDLIYIAPPQYHQLAAKALALVERLPLTQPGGLVIVQIFPKERVDLDEMPLVKLHQVDERRYGSTLLLFYEDHSPEAEAS
jgi:16S rRNA (guanine966-N2)-methyltransferase